MGHTPAPWQWRWSNNGETVDIADGQELIDSSLGAFFLEGGTRGEGIEVLSCDCVTVADGKLIKAAPDLLDACKVLLRAIERLQCGDADKGIVMRDAVEYATGIVAAAEGKP